MTSDRYKVFTTFCDDVTQDHDHSVLMVATKEFADKMAEAIEPTMGHPEARHVRMITFTKFDDNGNSTQFTAAGPFPCEDKGVDE